MSASVLNERLRELREAAIVELESQGYRLTVLGSELLSGLAPLDRWAKRWARSAADRR
jgi:DNA-binding HxlR family transcriptional regulator